MNRALIVVIVAMAASASALAGMPSVLPSDIDMRWQASEKSTSRLQAISFFLMGLVGSILAVKLLWNVLAQGVPALPRIDLLRATALVVLWGMIFTLVLTMISGARELMTPGAWKQNGFTYELQEQDGRKERSDR